MLFEPLRSIKHGKLCKIYSITSIRNSIFPANSNILHIKSNGLIKIERFTRSFFVPVIIEPFKAILRAFYTS